MQERFFRVPFLIKFLISGGTATATILLVLYILTEWFGMWYLFSAGIAFVAGTFVSFTLQKFWTFTDRRIDVLKKQAGWYVLIQIWDLGLNTLGLYILVEHFHVWYLVVQLALSALIMVQNILLYRAFIFTDTTS